MVRFAVDSIPISKFKATCLAVLEEVRRSGRPVLVTKRGEPIAEIVPPTALGWVGSARDRGRIVGDVVSPVSDPSEWEALEG